jgi:hypothetical protein
VSVLLRRLQVRNVPEAAPLTLIDAVGWIAAALTLLAFSMRAMLPLRIAGMAANVAFILYGVAEHLYPVVALHTLLLPCNVLRYCELSRQAARMERSAMRK